MLFCFALFFCKRPERLELARGSCDIRHLSKCISIMAPTSASQIADKISCFSAIVYAQALSTKNSSSTNFRTRRYGKWERAYELVQSLLEVAKICDKLGGGHQQYINVVGALHIVQGDIRVSKGEIEDLVG